MSATETFARLSGHQRIAGRLVHSSGSSAISVWDPATEERIGQIADANAADLDQAVAAANAAQRAWRNVNHHRRADMPRSSITSFCAAAASTYGPFTWTNRSKPITTGAASIRPR
jgi:acyl-CoA reductase-like NAD-dependent aldehyde dehydrogenase